jgi:hypothetical protein
VIPYPDYHGYSVFEIPFVVIEIDDCEYLMGVSYSKGFFAHKGNCKNPVHKYNQ